MMTKSFTLFAAVGFTLMGCGGAPSMPAAPTAPATPADPTNVAPGTADFDKDGVPDAMDKCPDKKEDGLPPEPKDGCPKAG